MDVVKLKQYAVAHSRELFLGCGLLAAGAAAVYFYADYRAQKEQAAQFDFSECYQQYRMAGIEDKAEWQEVEYTCKAGHEQHSPTTMGPYFLVVESQARAEQGDLKVARELLEQYLDAINERNPFYNIYRIKLALLQGSSDDSEVKQQGRALLERLAYDQKNLQQDQAMFYLAEAYGAEGDVKKADTVRKELVKQFGSSDMDRSPWAELARSKLLS